MPLLAGIWNYWSLSVVGRGRGSGGRWSAHPARLTLACGAALVAGTLPSQAQMLSDLLSPN
ncbi:MAG: hypothetical protein WBA29_06585, partial [Xanthobacteraceae bacterium]